jgi:hypothetical protein
VKKKIASATRTLHLLHRLLNSEWGLSAAAGRQLYIACIISISDYGCQVWFNNQKGFLNSFQKLQNSALRKILGAFKTSSSSAMKIEAAICPSIVRFQKACRLYALRIACMTENHPIRQRTSITYPPEYQTGLDLDENKFLDWNETSFQTRKKHPTQLVRILHTLSDLLPNTPKLEEYSLKEIFSVQKIADIQISKEDKDQTTKNHLNLVKRILPRDRNSRHTVIYTDGSKILVNVGADLAYMSGRNTGEKFWNLGNTLEVFDAELFAIYQAIKWTQSFDLGKPKIFGFFLTVKQQFRDF